MNQKNQNKSKYFAWLLFIASIAISIFGALMVIYIEEDSTEYISCMYPNSEPLIIFGSQIAAFIFGIIALVSGIICSRKKIGPFLRFIINMLIIFISLITIPNFLRFAGHSCQSEAKQNLGAIFTAYTAYYSDYNTYPAAPYITKNGKTYNCLNIAGWEPKGKIRYSYKCMGTVVYSPKRGGVDCEQAATGASQSGFTVAACANIDRDFTIDEWTIDTDKRLKNIVDDVKR